MKRRAQGFSYIALLILIAIIGITMAGASTFVSTTHRRDMEMELLYVGKQYARAIASYHSSSPGQAAYPEELEELLEDDRFPVTRRHLRKLFVDPMTHKAKWGLIYGPNNGIVGVYSLAEGKPLKQANFPREYAEFTGADTYAKWRFIGVSQVIAPVRPPVAAPDQ